MKILVVFGSASDKPVFQKLRAELDVRKIDYDLRIASAHKTPELLDEIMQNNYDFFIAGAGLSAALPGIVASKTLKPVIGIPVKGAFSGLDAMLSIWQMPPGIPVLGAPLENVDEAVKFAEAYGKGLLKKIIIIERSDEKASILSAKAESFLRENKVDFEKQKSDFPQYNNLEAVYIDFTDMNDFKVMNRTKAAVVYVPYTRRDATANDALKLLDAKYGLFVGLAMAENACIAAVQLANSNGKYDSFLQGYRKAIAEKVINAKP